MELKYLSGYSDKIKDDVTSLIESGKLSSYLLNNYSTPHSINNNSLLYHYVQNIKKLKMRQSTPLKSVSFGKNIRITHNALGLNRHETISHGKKLKTKKSIIISTVFKNVSEQFLEMIVAHELAHIKFMNHGKEFYNLATHICCNYYQVELDFRLYLTLKDLGKDIYRSI